MRTSTAVIWVTVTHSHVKTSSQPNMSLRTLFPRRNSSATAAWNIQLISQIALDIQNNDRVESLRRHRRSQVIRSVGNYLGVKLFKYCLNSEWPFHYSLQSVRVCPSVYISDSD